MKSIVQMLASFMLLLVCIAPFSAQAQKIKVILLGTFHFAQQDTTVFDILKPNRQREVMGLTQKIVRYKPDKVFIESMPEFENENKKDSLYQAFRNGDSLRTRNEISQIAYRVANWLGHKTIYQCDHSGRYGSLVGMARKYAAENNQTDILNYTARGTTKPFRIENKDSLYKNSTLINLFKHLNSKAVQETSQAAYVNVYPQVGKKNLFKYDSTFLLGAAVTTDWYRRNILMYTKMILQLDYTEKAIFLIVGNDHIPIIRHLFESNPYFEVVDVQKLLAEKRKPYL